MKRECDCEQCILGWEEWGLEDCDAGCYFYPDLEWNGIMCHAPAFIKKIIFNRKMRKRDKYYEKEWSDYDEFLKEQDRKENAMSDAIKEVLLQDGNMICYTGHDGKLHPYSSSYLYQHAWEVISKYEELLNRKESEKE